jgi:murein DD-endopeptidase MepM/ murein hydrolase activator NlpD
VLDVGRGLPGAFSFGRPFRPDLEVRGSAYYPYGTDAGGQLLLHHGNDIGNPAGTPVLSVGDGVVTYAGDDSRTRFGPTADFYGNLVVIRHDGAEARGLVAGDSQPLYSLYGHLSETKVASGDTVVAGTVVGLVGATGIAMGPHLHIEFRTTDRDYGATLNPALFMKHIAGHGAIVGRLVGEDGQPAPRAPVSLYRVVGGVTDWEGSTVTYPTQPVNSSAWSENFVFADLPAGIYAVASSGTPVDDGVTVDVVAGSAVGAVIRR